MKPDGDGNEAVRQQDQPVDVDTDPHPAGADGITDVVPQAGGYAGRDPKTEMPRMPSIPDTQDDAGAEDAASKD